MCTRRFEYTLVRGRENNLREMLVRLLSCKGVSLSHVSTYLAVQHAKQPLYAIEARSIASSQPRETAWARKSTATWARPGAQIGTSSISTSRWVASACPSRLHEEDVEKDFNKSSKEDLQYNKAADSLLQKIADSLEALQIPEIDNIDFRDG